jgi:hypothetical protein
MLKQNKKILICEWFNNCVMKVAVFNKNYSNETEVTKILSGVITPSNIKTIILHLVARASCIDSW